MAKMAHNFSAAEMRTDFRRFKDPFSAIKMLCFFIADSGVEFHAFYLSFHAAWFHNLSSTDFHIDS
jgi:hypothetical protein